jgi:hypothetical protein
MIEGWCSKLIGIIFPMELIGRLVVHDGRNDVGDAELL